MRAATATTMTVMPTVPQTTPITAAPLVVCSHCGEDAGTAALHLLRVSASAMGSQHETAAQEQLDGHGDTRDVPVGDVDGGALLVLGNVLLDVEAVTEMEKDADALSEDEAVSEAVGVGVGVAPKLLESVAESLTVGDSDTVSLTESEADGGGVSLLETDMEPLIEVDAVPDTEADTDLLLLSDVVTEMLGECEAPVLADGVEERELEVVAERDCDCEGVKDGNALSDGAGVTVLVVEAVSE